MYTIMGASGNVGFGIVKELVKRRFPVKAVVHQLDKAAQLKQLGAEIAFADVFDLPSLITAFTGSQAVFVITPETGHSLDVVGDTKTMLNNYREAIISCRVNKVVGLSSIGADIGAGSGNLEMSYLLEHAFDGLTVNQVFVRPAYYYSNWLMGVEQVKKTGLLQSFYPENFTISMVSPEDVARISAEQLIEEKTGKTIYEVEGPAEYSPADVARAMSNVLKKTVKVNQMPRETWEPALRQIGFSGNATENFVKMTDCVVNGQVKTGGKGILPLKGTTTLEQFINSFLGE